MGYASRPGGPLLGDGAPEELTPGVTLAQCGGHFDGSSVLHWAAGAGGKGALLVGDTLTVVQDRRHVSFMYSYPNLIPLSREPIERLANAVGPYEFDRIYGGWWEATIMTGGKAQATHGPAAVSSLPYAGLGCILVRASGK